MFGLSLTEDAVMANVCTGVQMSIFRNLQNKLLDGSIFFSFDRSGFIRHAQEYNTEDLNVDCTGKNYLITGANSGLGKATAIEIAQRGGTVYLLCRNEQRATNAQEEIIQKTKNQNITQVLTIS